MYRTCFKKRQKIKKKYGLVLDLKASSCIKICDRMNEYLNCNNGFPWNYCYENILIKNKKVMEHTLKLKRPKIKKR